MLAADQVVLVVDTTHAPLHNSRILDRTFPPFLPSLDMLDRPAQLLLPNIELSELRPDDLVAEGRRDGLERL